MLVSFELAAFVLTWMFAAGACFPPQQKPLHVVVKTGSGCVCLVQSVLCGKLSFARNFDPLSFCSICAFSDNYFSLTDCGTFCGIYCAVETNSTSWGGGDSSLFCFKKCAQVSEASVQSFPERSICAGSRKMTITCRPSIRRSPLVSEEKTM